MVELDKIVLKLTRPEKIYLLNKLKTSLLSDISTIISNCPCCNENNFIKKGLYKNTQRYKCKNTNKIFTYRTSTILSNIQHITKFNQLVDMLLKGKFPTLDEIQYELKISRKTAHDWRTKILSSMYQSVDFNNQIIEFDETNFRISRKGRQGMNSLYSRKRGKKLVGDNSYNVKVFMTYSRTTGRIELYQSHMGRTSSQDVENYLGVYDGLVAYTDKHGSYKKYFNDRTLIHKTFLSKYHISKTNRTVHNQTLNRIGGRLQSFLNDELRGVSTKYIQGYLNWFMLIEGMKKLKSELSIDIIRENKAALEVFKQKEKEFKYFLSANNRSIYGTFNDRYY